LRQPGIDAEVQQQPAYSQDALSFVIPIRAAERNLFSLTRATLMISAYLLMYTPLGAPWSIDSNFTARRSHPRDIPRVFFTGPGSFGGTPNPTGPTGRETADSSPLCGSE
jgi:hypothetical protein